MTKNKTSIYRIVFSTIILCSLIFLLGIDRRSYKDTPSVVYQVYLNGKTVGIIEDENELYNLIDKEQESLKKEYSVDKVYAPNDLQTTKLVTYTGEVDNVKDVYDKIKDVNSFTIKGYEVTIVHSEDDKEVINVLDLEDFDTAVDNTIKAFVDEDAYQKYLDGTQDKIVTTGSVIENINIREDITTKEKLLSADDKIFTNANDLSRYMLFGTTENQATHIVSTGETIKEIANDYQLSVNEFLIVNPDIISANALLFNGQVVNVGLINPAISIVVENTLVEDKVVTYNSEVKYDNKFLVGTTYTEQKGQDGLSRVTYYTETINGAMTQVIPMNKEVLTPVVNEVIVKGGLSINYVGDTSGWYWPTLKPYVMTDYFGWRIDPIVGTSEYHKGIDISGTGYGSPIYATQSGVISGLAYGYNYGYGNYIEIDHGNGYSSIYMHLAGMVDGLRLGQAVSKGELIGYMGSSGYSTGTHLHFQINYNGTPIDPLSLSYN